MGRAAAAAAAMAQAQGISLQESLELVKCLLRVSIFHVSYLRGIFPDDKFHAVGMKNLDGLHIKMLKPCCEESQRLVDWVEKGVGDALERGYMKSMFFGISEDPEGAELLEEYVFSFTYSDTGDLEMELAAGGTAPGAAKGRRKFPSKGNSATVDTVRYQVIRLMRMLVQICQTLDKVPTERYIFMKLTYQDHTPEDYEPPCFLPLPEHNIASFKRKPFSMHVGTVDTDHHNVALRIKSVLDAGEDQAAQEPEVEGMGSQQVSDMEDGDYDAPDAGLIAAAAELNQQVQLPSHVAAPAGDTTPGTMQHPYSHPSQRQQEDQDMSEVTEASEGAAAAAAAADEEEVLGTQPRHQQFEALQAYCFDRSQVSFADAMVRFDVHTETLEGWFQQLVAEGLLQEADAPDLYLVLGGRGGGGGHGGEGGEGGQHSNDLAAMDQDAAEDYMASRMTGLSVGRGPAAASAAHGHGRCDHEQKRQMMADASIAAKLQSTHAGSDLTASRQQAPPTCHEGADNRRGSGGSNGASRSVQQKPQDDPAPFFLDQSQQSLLPGKAGSARPSKRKASITNPIHQTANRVLRKKVAATPARGKKQQKTRLSGMR